MGPKSKTKKPSHLPFICLNFKYPFSKKKKLCILQHLRDTVASENHRLCPQSQQKQALPLWSWCAPLRKFPLSGASVYPSIQWQSHSVQITGWLGEVHERFDLQPFCLINWEALPRELHLLLAQLCQSRTLWIPVKISSWCLRTPGRKTKISAPKYRPSIVLQVLIFSWR